MTRKDMMMSEAVELENEAAKKEKRLASGWLREKERECHTAASLREQASNLRARAVRLGRNMGKAELLERAEMLEIKAKRLRDLAEARRDFPYRYADMFHDAREMERDAASVRKSAEAMED